MASAFPTPNPKILHLERRLDALPSVQSKMDFVYNNHPIIGGIPDETEQLLIVALFRLVGSENIENPDFFIQCYGGRLKESIINSDCLFNIIVGARPNIALQKTIYNYCREEIRVLANKEEYYNLFSLTQLALVIDDIDPNDLMFGAWFVKTFENKFQKAAEALVEEDGHFKGDYRPFIVDVLENQLDVSLDNMSLFEENLPFLAKEERMVVSSPGSEFFKNTVQYDGSIESDDDLSNGDRPTKRHKPSE
jgi:hypothetical protein